MQKYNLDKQHMKGKLHAIERIELLLDKNSFCEIGSGIVNHDSKISSGVKRLPYDGVITGYGTINGQIVYIYAQDFTVNGGTLGLNHGKKISHVIQLAIKQKCPVIGINDSGGARIQEGVNSLAGYGEVFYANTMASGYIPQISIIAGPCAGGAVYSPGITDFVFVIDKISQMFVTGPKVVKSVTGQECTPEELGGARVHANKSGVAHFYHDNERDCFDEVRQLIDILSETKSNKEFNQSSTFVKKRSKIDKIIPNETKKIYNIKNVITDLIDDNSFIEVQSEFARNLVVGFGKLSNRTVGIVANQPDFLGGTLDTDSSDKGARFVRYCDAFDIPIITLVDVPGFMPGIQQEHSGIIRHGAKLLYAYSEATTIKLTVILRKAYGGAYIAMGSKHLRADFVYALKSAQVAVMGAEGAVPIIYRSKINELSDQDKTKFIQEMIDKYNNELMNVSAALEEGYVDEIIEAEEIRKRLYQDIIALQNKKETNYINKKHGCIPL